MIENTTIGNFLMQLHSNFHVILIILKINNIKVAIQIPKLNAY